MKKLRYGVEYLAGLYDSKEVKRYRRACEGLQEVLGTINDAAATDRIAAKLAEKGRPDLVPPIGALAARAAIGACRSSALAIDFTATTRLYFLTSSRMARSGNGRGN